MLSVEGAPTPVGMPIAYNRSAASYIQFPSPGTFHVTAMTQFVHSDAFPASGPLSFSIELYSDNNDDINLGFVTSCTAASTTSARVTSSFVLRVIPPHDGWQSSVPMSLSVPTMSTDTPLYVNIGTNDAGWGLAPGHTVHAELNLLFTKIA